VKDRYLIGEIAKMYGISMNTLRYYDEIGLFKSVEVDKENKYRYYKFEQFSELNTVRMLKLYGLSLKKIKALIDDKNPETLLKFLREEKVAQEKKLKALELSTRRIEEKVAELEYALHSQHIGRIEVREIPDRKVVILEKRWESHADIEMATKEIVLEAERRKLTTSTKFISLKRSVDDLRRGQFDICCGVSLPLDDGEEETGGYIRTVKGGTYVTACYRFSHWSDKEEYYGEILKYIVDNGYEIVGDASERPIIGPFFSNDPERFVTEIEIPVCKT
jgi:DNA-binding transcriptional MerR regulator